MRSSILSKALLQLRDDFNGLTTEQQAIFLDLVDPVDEPAPKAKAKAKRKSTTKSPRATKLGEQIAGNLQQREPKAPICVVCGYEEDYQDHKQPSPNYHPFEASPKAAVATGD